MMTRKLAVLPFVLLFATAHVSRGQESSAAATDERIAQLTVGTRVLFIAAHPDDEDTQLITWLARGRHVKTAYLSLNRGDGGQNLIGNELGEALGVIRTQELLAARRVDHAHQYFTRAFDFGFSKDTTDTYAHWPRDSVLGDVVKVVRAFRPQIIITTFSGTPRDGHGHHQVSAILAKAVYDSAAEDTVRFPVAKFGAPWRVLKMYRGAFFSPAAATIAINVGEYNPILGESYSEIAAESRSQHKSQGFGTLRRKGVIWDRLTRVDARVGPADPKSERSIFDGIDTTAVPVPADSLIAIRREADIAIEAVADRGVVALGDSVRVQVSVFNRGKVADTVLEPVGDNAAGHFLLAPDSVYKTIRWVKGRQLTQPWWLATPRNGDLFSPEVNGISDDERDQGPWIDVPVQFAGLKNPVWLRAPVISHFADPVRGDVQRPLMVAPGISVTLDRTVEIARAGAPINRAMGVTLRSALGDTTPVTVRLNLPNGLSADPVSRTVSMTPGMTSRVTFRIKGTLPKGQYAISAVATAAGHDYATGYVPVEYEHITPSVMYRPSTVTLNAIDFALAPRLSVAYVPGVGDNVEPMVEEMGVPVTVLQPSDIPAADLSKFTTIVIGPRAYQASQILRDNNSYLLDYVRNGGRLVVQYGQYELMQGLMPYPITIRRPHDRVTEENAAVTILDPAAAVLNIPNKISQSDFEGWVQERALYMPYTFDPHYHAALSMHDTGEAPLNGAIITAQYGKGTYMYVPLALFRQLPAGVSGGARIFANLLAGK